MEAMSAALRQELAPFDISVSSINPGFVRTEILHYAKKDDFFPTDPAQVARCKSSVCMEVRYGSIYFAP